MFGRALGACGWLAWRVRRLASGSRAAPYVVAAVLLVLAAVPIVVPLFDPQPQDVTVQEVIDGAVTEPSGWVRLRGELVPLPESPTGEPGTYGLLVDGTNTLRAIVVAADVRPEADEATMVTGHLGSATILLEEEGIPLDATVFGAPPIVVGDQIVELDPVAEPERVTWWPLSIPPLIVAIVLLVGARAGYPVFRPTSEVDVLSSPLAPGERVPAAFGGRVGPTVHDLSDPGGALLVVRPGPKGNVLSVQPLSDDGRPAPPPVPIGGGSSRGRIGWVFTVSEAVPALAVRSEGVEATLLFAKTGERDRVAALVAVDRD